jgi:hypothetical protein
VPRYSITTLGLPASGFTAFMAPLIENPTSVHASTTQVSAILGNVPIGSPRPAAMSDDSWGDRLQGSSNAPNYFLPVIYVARMNKWLVTIRRRFVDLPMPIPAVAYNATTTADNLKARIGGRTATPAVQARPYWPSYGRR